MVPGIYVHQMFALFMIYVILALVIMPLKVDPSATLPGGLMLQRTLTSQD